MPRYLINSFLLVGMGKLAIASTLAVTYDMSKKTHPGMPKLTFGYIDSKVGLLYSLEESIYLFNMFLPAVTVDNDIIYIGLTSFYSVDNMVEVAGAFHHLIVKETIWCYESRYFFSPFR